MASSTTVPELPHPDDPSTHGAEQSEKLNPVKMSRLDHTNYPALLPTPPFVADNERPSEHPAAHGGPSTSSSAYTSALGSNLAAYKSNARLSASAHTTTFPDLSATHALSELHVKTDLPSIQTSLSPESLESDHFLRETTSASSIPRRIPSLRATLHSSAGSLSPGSAISSPQLAALLDISPLPSPVLASRDLFRNELPSRPRNTSTTKNPDFSSLAAQPGPIPLSSPPRRKAYAGIQLSALEGHLALPHALISEDVSNHTRTRSLSEYVPGALAAPKPRHIAVSGSGAPADVVAAQNSMQREEYLAVQRGLTLPIVKPPTPPRSTVGGYTSGEDDDEPAAKRVKTEVYTAQSIAHGHSRRYKAIKFLGQGTFSKVFLAVRQVDSGDDGVDYSRASTNMAGVRLRSRRLVAVKVVEPGPAGGADEQRIEMSLKREVDIMKSITHPSLVHLKAFGTAERHRALLIMNYCPGGDLFEVASTNLEVLTPNLVRRIFSELVSAVRYLHQKFIIHRDIKLESTSHHYVAS